jgi:hypothetical protein
MINELEVLRQFRQAVYQGLGPSRDAAFEIMDAIANSPQARSAVEVSLSPFMQRTFSSVYKGLERSRPSSAALRSLLVPLAERQGNFQVQVAGSACAVYALDHTPYPRPSAPTVRDRSYVHGAQGVQVGHQYSLLGRVLHTQGSWMGLVDGERIATSTTPTAVAATQIQRLHRAARLPLLITADSEYVTEAVLDTLCDAQAEPEAVPLYLLLRFKGNRNLYAAPPTERRPGQRGPSPPHGAKLKLNCPETLGTPELSLRVEEAHGSWAEIEVWPEVHVETRPHIPLCAVRVRLFKADGQPRYQRPLWLAWSGPVLMDWANFWRVYLRRFCLEAVHQFSKNSLSWTRARLGDTEREERWSWLVWLAYWQLVLAAPLARDARRPWEKPTRAGRLPTPGRVQRDFGSLLGRVGSPVRAPIPRGFPTGRPLGYHPEPRPRYEVVYKGAT